MSCTNIFILKNYILFYHIFKLFLIFPHKVNRKKNIDATILKISAPLTNNHLPLDKTILNKSEQDSEGENLYKHLNNQSY